MRSAASAQTLCLKCHEALTPGEKAMLCLVVGHGMAALCERCFASLPDRTAALEWLRTAAMSALPRDPQSEQY